MDLLSKRKGCFKLEYLQSIKLTLKNFRMQYKIPDHMVLETVMIKLNVCQ